MREPTTSLTLGAEGIANRLASGDLSAREVVEEHIQRIEEVNPRLNAVVVPLFDQARNEAAAADAARSRGEPLGPLHGVPVTIKEQFLVAGTPTTVGLPGRVSHRAESDGPLVQRLRQSGAIVLGKTNVSQLLIYHESDNPVYGRTNNPWDPDRTPGGSSGGEAAIVAADEARFHFDFEVEWRGDGLPGHPELFWDEGRGFFRFPDGRFALSRDHANWPALKEKGFFRELGM